MILHTVAPGETLGDISLRYGVPVTRLAFDNDITDPDRLAVGQPVFITVPEIIHFSSDGDSVPSLADRYGVSEGQLRRNNLFLNGGDYIPPDSEIYISVRREPIGEYVIGGYAYPFIGTAMLDRSLPFLSCIIPFTYGFRPDGTLVPLDDERMIAHAKKFGSQPVMHLSTLTENDTFSSSLALGLFESRAVQETLMTNVIDNMLRKGYTALDVDFEFLGREGAQGYYEFIAYCSERLEPYRFPLIVALAPKTSDDQPGSLYEGHDYALLGSVADAVLLMTYEWGYTYGPPMAVSPAKPVQSVIDYAKTRIPASKILLGISNYGYDFTLPYVEGESRAVSLSTERAFSLAAEKGSEIFYDTEAQAPYFEYEESGVRHRVWFEDGRSIGYRLQLLAENGLKGALYWNMNRENNQNLIVLNGLINSQKNGLF